MRVIKHTTFGVYLSKDGDEAEILLPIKYVPLDTAVDDFLTVFIYNDSEGRIIATTLEAKAEIGEFVMLTVVSTTEIGAFLDLGIAKDVFVPIREQAGTMRLGGEYIVYLYIDEKSNRIVASSKWNKFLKQEELDLVEGEEVDLFITAYTDLGYNAIVNNKFIGLIYHNDIFEPIGIGERKRGFIKKIREENKIDLSLRKVGYDHILDSKTLILNLLKENDGVLALGDKSSPEQIEDITHLSKKAYKKTIGGMYKDGLITILDTEIRLIKND
jgi:uncharacterized protein